MKFIPLLLALFAPLASASICTTTEPVPGLTSSAGISTLTWRASSTTEARARFSLVQGTPVIAELSLRSRGGVWRTLAHDLRPEFRVASGYRRLDQEALPALEQSVGPITQSVLDHYKWDAFWDAPLHLPGGEMAHHGATPPPDGIPGTDQPGLPRKPEEVTRAAAIFHVTACTAHAEGARIELNFPGVTLGVFSGSLRFTVYQGSALLRMEVLATTQKPSVAYKYDAGLTGLPVTPHTSLAWHDVSSHWQTYDLSSGLNPAPAVIRSANRILTFTSASGSVATFPPPHNFFWVREISTNQGYTWFRKDSAATVALGICQAEQEDDPAYVGRGGEDRRQNFALYNARPGTLQRMPVYFLLSPGDAHTVIDTALRYTHADHYPHLDGFWVMARHFHTSPVTRLLNDRGLASPLPDFELARLAGVNLFGPVGGGSLTSTGEPLGLDQRAPTRTPEAMAAARTKGKDETRFAEQAAYYEMARLQSRPGFLVMPNEEQFSGPIAGHNDILVAHPVFWTNRRLPGQPFTELLPAYGRVYHLGTPADLMEMTHRENMLVFTPHPDTKASAGYPRAFKDQPYFRDQNYRGIGFRWGMGIDRSEQRLCDFRCMPLFDEMNNWLADTPFPKYMDAIAETYQLGAGDDFYANTPVTYVHTRAAPAINNFAPIIDSMRRGDFFVSTGEVLIPHFALTGAGPHRTLIADVTWTFPLDFAEIVWGDGHTTGRQIISLASLPEFGRKHFALPLEASGKKWVRFAVWDTAGNGAFVQPVRLAQ